MAKNTNKKKQLNYFSKNNFLLSEVGPQKAETD